MSTTYGERLELAMQSAKKSRKDLAAKLVAPDGSPGVSPSAISQVVRGISKSLSAENSAIAAKELGVSGYWLATGRGPMTDAHAASRLSAEEPPAAFGATPEQVMRALHDLLREADPLLRSAIADLLHAWARDGASEDRGPAICRLLDSSWKLRHAARLKAS